MLGTKIAVTRALEHCFFCEINRNNGSTHDWKNICIFATFCQNFYTRGWSLWK